MLRRPRPRPRGLAPPRSIRPRSARAPLGGQTRSARAQHRLLKINKKLTERIEEIAGEKKE